MKLWGEGKGCSLLKALLTYNMYLNGLLDPMPFYRSKWASKILHQ